MREKSRESRGPCCKGRCRKGLSRLSSGEEGGGGGTLQQKRRVAWHHFRQRGRRVDGGAVEGLPESQCGEIRGFCLFLRGQGALMLGWVCRALHGQGLRCFPLPGTALDRTHMDENQDEVCGRISESFWRFLVPNSV